MPETQFLPDEAATISAAQDLAKDLKTGDAILLNGDLGAGKSTFARALIRALPLADGSLNPEETIPSPTYTLVQVYERALGPVAHFDLYRLGDPEEVWELGLEEALAEGLSIIEWPERLGSLLPQKALSISLEDQGAGRLLRLVDART